MVRSTHPGNAPSGNVGRRGAFLPITNPETRIPNPRRLLELLLAQLAGEGAAVHAEAAGGFGDVEAGFGQDLADPLPFQGLDRGRALAKADFGIALGLAEVGLDVFGVRRLGQVLAGAELDGFD